MSTVDGYCDAAFAAVRAAFEENLASRGELGASLCVRVGGREVVDLWGGHRDRAGRRPWQRDTLVNAWSVGKGVLAILALALAERGRLDLDAPVAVRWPEFAAAGKGDLTLRTLMSHRAGLPAIRPLLPVGGWQDWDLVAGALAAQEPWWEPGSAHGYHVNAYGFLVGEVVRRATGDSPGAALHKELAGPRAADFWWGLPEGQHHRVAEVHVPNVLLTRPEDFARAFPPTGDADHDTMIWHAYFNPPGVCGVGVMDTPAWLRAQVPSTNGHATARGVARLYGSLLGRGAVVGRELLAEATRVHSDGEDRVLGRASRFGLGFQLATDERPLGRSPAAFGHYGHGGLLGMADPEAGVAFGFLTSRPGQRWQTPRTQALLDAVYDSLGG